MKKTWIIAIVSGLFLPVVIPVKSAVAANQAVEQVHVRGSIVGFNGDALKVKTRAGEVKEVTLAEGWKLASVAQANLADIKAGDFVGIASAPRANGGDGALEVLIFPPALKGTNEGNFSWDLKPRSSMTNATVTAADPVKEVEGRAVTVSYHGTEKKIVIPDGAPVVTLAPATKDDLLPGAVVFILATKDDKGTVAARQVIVGKNGIIPPM